MNTAQRINELRELIHGEGCEEQCKIYAHELKLLAALQDMDTVEDVMFHYDFDAEEWDSLPANIQLKLYKVFLDSDQMATELCHAAVADIGGLL